MKLLDEKCVRCGSPIKITKTWKETIKTYAGTSVLEITETACTNDKCQEVFDKVRIEETKKKNEIKLRKQAQEEIRRNNKLKMNQKKVDSLKN